jgi:hypothetical protein
MYTIAVEYFVVFAIVSSNALVDAIMTLLVVETMVILALNAVEMTVKINDMYIPIDIFFF